MNEPTATLILTLTEINALTALTVGGCQAIESAAGRDNMAWILVNSLRTHFSEVGYSLDPVKDQHPCRECNRMPWEHPQADCEAWS